MRWLGLIAITLSAAVLWGCSLDAELSSGLPDADEPMLAPSKRLTSPEQFTRFAQLFRFDNGSCALGNSPNGACLNLDGFRVGPSTSFVLLCLVGMPCAIPVITRPSTLGSSPWSGEQGLVNRALRASDDTDLPLEIFFSFPMIKVGMYLLPQPEANGRQRAILTGYDQTGRKITSAARPIPGTQAVFLGIGSSKPMRRVTLRYESALPELIDDLYVEPDCPSVEPNISEGQPLDESLDILGPLTPSSRNRIIAKLVNHTRGNNVARNVPVFFSVYRDSVHEPNLLLRTTRTIRSLALGRATKVSIPWIPPSAGKYIAGYQLEGFPVTCAGFPAVVFIGEEVDVR